ncbi:MAG TPA: (d)CMP kinase [Roseiflexaceae bacterium]|nr:(d)CMP kinase [Roseiflexaceae bacterium]
MSIPFVITIDGPAGAGKSTLGELLARRLGYMYFDTGVMYRALTLASIERDIPPGDAAQMEGLAGEIKISVLPAHIDDGRANTVLLDGRDVTWDLRRPEVEKRVSLASSHPAVRATMRARQRAIGLRGRVVIVGRDIGSVVMPDAGLKIYLEASLEERARRRTDELRSRGRAVELGAVQDDVARRDALDRHVMVPAPDAIVIQGDNLSPEEEVELVLEHLRKTGGWGVGAGS